MIIDNAGTYTLRYTATDDCGKTTTVDRELVVQETLRIVPWSTGTDEEIVKMVQAADRGEINLSDYWQVGDERVVRLSAMEAMSPLTDAHEAQDVTLVLMNAGGKTLNTPTESGRTSCSFIVGQKDSLNTSGRINSDNTNNGGWESCPRRTWCNSVYYNAIPSTLRPIFKQVQNATANGGTNASATIQSVDYFALPAEREVHGQNYKSNSTYESSGLLSQFNWYRTGANKIKKRNGTNSFWWLRSPCSTTIGDFCYITGEGQSGNGYTAYAYGISPFGAI